MPGVMLLVIFLERRSVCWREHSDLRLLWPVKLVARGHRFLLILAVEALVVVRVRPEVALLLGVPCPPMHRY